ncbi:Low-density lipoprotein receptor-related protein 5 [Eumeta japonica]|uniref:Low-density lipoprotein receptor-related protein 5 n=1 Tax=Eumeta variegata TaxID=151549 RepID=A0A4C2AD07_EUMVA|nr:Low-density lipoprotein receptor-related protein 5 [Eumeta japonica]
MESPRAIAADPRKGYLFWTDWNNRRRVSSGAHAAGTERITVVRVDWRPNGITLDYAAERVYWIDARPILSTRRSTTAPPTRSAARARDAFASVRAHLVRVARVLDRLAQQQRGAGRQVARRGRRRRSANADATLRPQSTSEPVQRRGSAAPCETDNGGCSHLCLVESATVRRCACPHVMRLATDGVRCEPHERVARRRGAAPRPRRARRSHHPHGVGPAVSATDLAAVPRRRLRALLDRRRGELAVYCTFMDSYFERFNLRSIVLFKNLMVCDSQTNEIKRTGLTRGPLRTVVDTGLESPRGFALDWLAHLLFYTSARPGGDVIAVHPGRRTARALVRRERRTTSSPAWPLIRAGEL